MKILLTLITVTFFLISCTDSGKQAGVAAAKDSTEKQHFFPVTDYLKGEIYTIKKNGINPLKYTTVNERTDSVWLKIEELDFALQEFLHPEIDSANLNTLFTEKSFFDQSINAITFTYDPAKNLPDTMQLKHWDVYVDPETNRVKRIYMLKEISKEKTMQLTWLNNQWCKIVYITTDEKGISKIEKEEKFILEF
jgi:hypothetical protein